MSPTEIALTVGIVVLVGAVLVVAWLWWRHRSLRARFGPEYDRAAAEHESTLATDRHLRERERKHQKLELRPLDPQTRQRYADAWQQVQLQFVETPQTAIEAAQELLVGVAAARGYPTEDQQERIEQLSVDHARTLGYYREAAEIYERHQQGRASTEDLRQALVNYRALFAELLGEEPVDARDAHQAGSGSARADSTDRERSSSDHNPVRR